MPRRPSGTPIEDADEQVVVETFSSKESGAITVERHHTLHVDVPAHAGEWNKKLQGLESSPRARTSASWKRQLAAGPTPETAADKVLLAGEGKSPDSMADTRGALK